MATLRPEDIGRAELEEQKAFLLGLLDVLRNYTVAEIEDRLAEVRFLLGEDI